MGGGLAVSKVDEAMFYSGFANFFFSFRNDALRKAKSLGTHAIPEASNIVARYKGMASFAV